MTYDKNENKSESYDYARGPRGPHFGPGHEAFGWARQPGFHPLKAVATVAAFAVFPPLGVLTLGYFLFSGRRGWQGGASAYGGGGLGVERSGCGWRSRRGPWTGNQAFDEHQLDEINKLRAEREAFWAFRKAERAKRDREAYDTFRAAQAKGDEAKPDDSQA